MLINCNYPGPTDFMLTCTNCGTANCDVCAELKGAMVDCPLCGNEHMNYHCRNCGVMIREFDG